MAGVLGKDLLDQTGPNAGFYERATGVEICDYFQKVLDEVLLPSGKVRFFGMCDYVGNWSSEHAFMSRLTGNRTAVRVRRKVVDTTYLESSVPATHTPSFEVDPGVRFFPVGDLAALAETPSGYTILGAGKTAMDSCSWLLDNGVDPDRIRWVRPRDAWLMDRAFWQPLDLVAATVEGLSLGVEALAHAENVDDLFHRLEACGQLRRLDRKVAPTMYRGAILSAAERKGLEQIENVVRLRRVRRLSTDRIVLEDGEIPTDRSQVRVDCTAYGFRTAPVRPIFEPRRITIQSLMGGFTTFNAALIGFVEATRRDDAEKNRLCPPTPQPSRPIDWIRALRSGLSVSAMHASEPDLAAWLKRSRLNLTRGMGRHMSDPHMQLALSRWAANTELALKNAEKLLAESSAPSSYSVDAAELLHVVPKLPVDALTAQRNRFAQVAATQSCLPP